MIKERGARHSTSTRNNRKELSQFELFKITMRFAYLYKRLIVPLDELQCLSVTLTYCTCPFGDLYKYDIHKY